MSRGNWKQNTKDQSHYVIIRTTMKQTMKKEKESFNSVKIVRSFKVITIIFSHYLLFMAFNELKFFYEKMFLFKIFLLFLNFFLI